MTTLPPIDYLVNTLRNTSQITAEHYCQCGAICRKDKPCMPVAGPVEVIYTTVAEKVQTQTGRKMWAPFSFDPMSGKRYIHNNHWHESPCKAATSAMRIAADHGYQLRLDKAADHHAITVDLLILERKLAADLYNAGYAAYLDEQPLRPRAHALTRMGYNAARNETTAAIAEKDAGYADELDDDLFGPAAVSWNSDAEAIPVPVAGLYRCPNCLEDYDAGRFAHCPYCGH